MSLFSTIGLATPERLPGAQYLESWHTAQRRQTLAIATTSMVRTGTSPAVNCTGTAAFLCDLRIKVTLGGARGTATVQFSIDGGSTYNGSDLLSSSSPVALTGTGLSANFATGTYVLNDTYRLPWGTWSDSSRRGITFAQSANGQVPVVDMAAINGRPALVGDGTDDVLENSTSAYATALCGGEDTPCTFFTVGKIVGSAASQHFFWALANAAVTTGALAFMSLSNLWQIDKRGDTGLELLVSGGTTDTSPHVFEVVQHGTTASLWVDGTLTINAVAQDRSSASLTKAQLFGVKSAANAYGNVAIGEHIAYRGERSAAERAVIRQYLKLAWGL